MNIRALRDHADEMLTTIATDLATPQDAHAQAEKSKGHAPRADAAARTAAGEHGAGRAGSGFTVEQMVAEYRALRASVIRLWTREIGALGPGEMDDLVRFNEAIDQALTESVFRYNQQVEQAKEIFLAILGHDLRLPLAAIYTSATFMLETGELVDPYQTLTGRIANSARRTVTMVGDLLDFTRARLGGGIPVTRAEMNLGRVVRDVVDEVSAAQPESEIRVDTRGEHTGQWDAARISQAVANLVSNAVQHGAPGTPVTVELRGDAGEEAVSIHNCGAAIPPDQLDGLFNPMKAREAPQKPSAQGPTGSLGLGLYIADRIVSAHGGHIEVASSEKDGTTFIIHLPR